MARFPVPNEAQKQIMRRNGVDPEGKVVAYTDETSIILLCLKTRDRVTISQGDKKW